MYKGECFSKERHYTKSATCFATDRWCRIDIYKCEGCGNYIKECECGDSYESKCTCLPDCSVCGKNYDPTELDLYPFCSQDCKKIDDDSVAGKVSRGRKES